MTLSSTEINSMENSYEPLYKMVWMKIKKEKCMHMLRYTYIHIYYKDGDISIGYGFRVFIYHLRMVFMNYTLITHSIFSVVLASVSDGSVGSSLSNKEDPTLISRTLLFRSVLFLMVFHNSTVDMTGGTSAVPGYSQDSYDAIL